MTRRTQLRRSDFIVPVFVTEGQAARHEIPSMPGVHQMSVDVCLDWLAQRADGFKAFLAFGVIPRSKKDETGSAALDPDNVICRLLREVKGRQLPLVAITDLCLCEYTSHGHCGPLMADRGSVANDATLPLLMQQAVNHAAAGADLVAPSGMMDGSVGAIRRALDGGGFQDTGVLAYSVKYASAFYGPFRDAADASPAFGDRNAYQMDPARGVEEALREVQLDIKEGADLVMVKPAGPYLDILHRVHSAVDVPVVAYQTSGEFAMIEAAARNGWIDRDRAILESLIAIKRAGADLVISYFAEDLARLLAA